jgi:hypothetical protein
MKNKKGEVMNLYEIVPRPLVKSETNSNGQTILLKPKFRNSFFAKIFLRDRKPNYFKLKLDEIGAACWSKIDGHKNAGEICNELGDQFGERIQPVAERVGKFLVMLKKAHLIEY